MLKKNYGPFPFSPIIDRPKLAWPGGAKLALWVIPNVEFFILDHGMPGDENQRPDPNAKHPDVRRWSQREYGNRVGIWRILEVLQRYGVRPTVALNSIMCDSHPRVVRALQEAGADFMGHCQSNTRRLTEVPNAAVEIATALDRIEAFTGARPRGWLGAGLEETWDTVDLLAANGVEYVADWVADDQPFEMSLEGGRSILSVPYSYDTNDIPIFVYKKYSVAECEELLKRQFDTLYREGETSGRVMAICIHPWVIGQPHRISALDNVLSYISGHDGVWKATGIEIARHFRAAQGTVAA